MSDTRLDFITSDSKNFLTSDGLQYRVKGQADPDHTVTITLYQCSAEANRVDKSNYLTSVGTLTGVFRAECSITNPTILYEKETLGTPVMPRFNYVYINQFQRYYFVTDLTSVSTTLWRMDLKEDPLYTYETGIGNLSAFVERNENTYDNLIHDEYQTFKNSNTYLFALPTSITGQKEFSTSSDVTIDRYVAGGLAYQNVGSTYFPTFQREFTSNCYYVMNNTQARSFCDEILDNGTAGIIAHYKNYFSTEPYQVINSFKAYPFDVSVWASAGVVSTEQNIAFAGKGLTTLAHVFIPSAAVNLTRFRSYDFTNYGSLWVDYDDVLELYLPFAGFVTLDARDVYGKYLIINLTVDYSSGEGTYSIYASEVDSATSTKYLTSATGMMGIDIPIASNNYASRLRGLVSGMAGLVTGNIGAGYSVKTAGGFLQTAGGNITNAFIPSLTPIGGSNTAPLPALFNPLETFVRIVRKTRVARDYASLRGYPLRQVKTLSSLTGFTQCGDVHVEGTAFKAATLEETMAVASKLKEGVIL